MENPPQFTRVTRQETNIFHSEALGAVGPNSCSVIFEFMVATFV